MRITGRKPATLHPYAWAVLKGQIAVGLLVRLACERSYRDHRGAKARGLSFSVERATRTITFIERFCRHSKGEWAGDLFELAPWQEFIVWELFGWLRTNGTRRFRSCHIEVARKNGKTTWLAAIGLYCLVADGEGGAEVCTAATKKDQAKIMHTEAVNMVAQDPHLGRRLTTTRTYGILDDRTLSKYTPLSADSKTLDGLNISAGLVDELHAHPNADLWQVIETSQGARLQPLMLSITTAGSDTGSFCYARRDYGVQVLEEVIEDDALLVYIATLDKGDDWRDPATWIKGNPSLGVTVREEELAEQIRKAENSPREQNGILRLRLNVWTQAATRFLDPSQWAACGGDRMPWEIEHESEGRLLVGGLDLASNTDVAAFVGLVPPEGPDDPWLVIPRFWIPEDDLLERVKETKVPYDVWIDQGFLVATPGNVIDFRTIKGEILGFRDRFDLREIAFDPWNATQISTELQDEGVEMVRVPSNYLNMSPPTKLLETLVLAGALEHGNHPVLTWMANNLEVKEHDGAIRPVKPGHKMSHKKIDGMVALIMALGRATSGDDGNVVSVYEERGLTIL